MRFRRQGVHPTGRAFTGRRLGIFLAAVSILGVGLTSSAVPASADYSYETIVNAHSQQCLTSGGKDDTVATQYPCNGSPNQGWAPEGGCIGNSRFCQVINESTGQCLGVAGSNTKSAGAEVVVWRCDGSEYENQYWQWQESTAETANFLDNLNSGLYLTLKCGCDTKSAPMDQEPQNVMGSPSQLWFV